MSHRLINWFGWSGLDPIGRLALLTGSTAIFSRYLTPHDFGGGAAPSLLNWSRAGRCLALAPAWIFAGLTGVFVAGFHRAAPGFGQMLELKLSVGLGLASYGLFLVVFARSHFNGLSHRLIGRKAEA